MNRVVNVRVVISEDDWNRLLRIVNPYKPDAVDRGVSGQVTVELNFDANHWDSLRPELEKIDIVLRQSERDHIERHFSYREICIFSGLEVKQAELFVVYDRAAPVDRDSWKNPIRFDYTNSGTDDLPTPWCWQMEPFRIAKSKLPKQTRPLWNTMALEWGVSQAFVDIVVGVPAVVENIGFREIYDTQGNVAEGYWQLTGKHQLPEYAPQTTGLGEGKCVEIEGSEFWVGGGDLLTEGFFPVLDRDEVIERFGTIPEWSFSHGLCGDFWDPDEREEQTAPLPRPIVGRRAMEILNSFKRNKLEFVPVTWVSDI